MKLRKVKGVSMQKIVIFTSPGGGGHIAASSALKSYLTDYYEVDSVFLLQDLLKSYDPIRLLTSGAQGCEGFYNFLMKHKQWWLINCIYYIGRLCFKPLAPLIRKTVIRYLKDNNIDMVISVMPLFNDSVLRASRELDIPFLLVPTDLDVRSFVFNIKNNVHRKFKINLIFNDYSIRKNLNVRNIGDSRIVYNGFPLRPEFFEKKDKLLLRKSFGINENVPVLMMMMGLQGADSMVDCVKSLLFLPMRLHILVCIGKNSTLKNRLAEIILPPLISVSIIEETSRISDFMAISDLIYTKTGSASFCEIIQMKLPMMIDGTSKGLVWERFNHDFAQKHGLGVVIRNYEEIPRYVEEFFKSDIRMLTIRQNMEKFYYHNTRINIQSCVAQMLASDYNFDKQWATLSKRS